jgi:hypothetical protein
MSNGALAKLSETAVMSRNPTTDIVASGQPMQRVETGYVTAVRVQVQREKRDVLRRVMEEVEIDPSGLMYRWTAKNKDGSRAPIEGPTIKMAMMIAREYGNCATEAELLQDDGTHWLFEGRFVDIETGFTCRRLFRQRKPMSGKGRMDLDRTEDISFQIGQSKAIRNAVTNSISQAILRRAMKAAKGEVAKELTSGGKPKAIDRIKSAFKKLGITLGQIEEKTGKPVAEWSKEDLAEIRAIYDAIEDGETTVENEFEPNKESVLDGEK